MHGEQPSSEACILAVADAFDAMTSDRPYRRALSATKAIEETSARRKELEEAARRRGAAGGVGVISGFVCPVPGSRFINDWGFARSGGRSHKGTDIMSPKGTPVLAVADGIVHEMGTHRLSGYFVRLDHGNGYLTTYMHLNNDTLGTDDGDGGPWTAYHATLYEGKEVRAGEVIGYVGDSGNAEGTKPHTHFEINLDGHKKNPYPWLADAWIKTHSDPQLPITIPR